MVHSPARYYGELGPIFRAADLAIVNLEGVLGDGGRPVVKDGRHMRLSADTVNGLLAAPFQLICLANNHSMDFGLDGLASTQRLLTEHGLSFVGAGCNGEAAQRPFVTEIQGVRLAVVNGAEGEESRSLDDRPGVADLSEARLSRQIAALRDRVDVVVAVLHAGREFLPVPPPYIQRVYRALAKAGADLVVGHHPHVPQGMEVYRGCLIAYSLGNFALWIPDGSAFRRLGYLVNAHFCGPRLIAAQVIPYRIEAERLVLLTGDARKSFLRDLAWASEPLSDPSKVATFWRAYVGQWLERDLTAEIGMISSLLLGGADLQRAWLSALSARSDIRARLGRYGVRLLGGLVGEVTSDQDPIRRNRGAAILRNRFDTLAHRELYLAALERCMRGEEEPAPGWATDLIERWGVFAQYEI